MDVVIELIEKYNACPTTMDLVSLASHGCTHGSVFNTYLLIMSRSFQSGIEPVHVCAQFGFTDLLDMLCEKYGASPTSEMMMVLTNNILAFLKLRCFLLGKFHVQRMVLSQFTLQPSMDTHL